jgi:hypothetical protein
MEMNDLRKKLQKRTLLIEKNVRTTLKKTFLNNCKPLELRKV